MVTLFNILRKCQTVCTTLHSYHHGMTHPISPHPHQHFLYIICLFYPSHPTSCEVVSLLLSLMTNAEHLFMCLQLFKSLKHFHCLLPVGKAFPTTCFQTPEPFFPPFQAQTSLNSGVRIFEAPGLKAQLVEGAWGKTTCRVSRPQDGHLCEVDLESRHEETISTGQPEIALPVPGWEQREGPQQQDLHGSVSYCLDSC